MSHRSIFKAASQGAILFIALVAVPAFSQNLVGQSPSTLRETLGGPPQQTITWGTQADSLRGRSGQSFTVVCPGNGSLSSRIWGTDVYTDDSSICTAAVHAGLITVNSGGVVVIEIRAGLRSYASTTRNRVTSRGYGSWRSSFVFVGGQSDGGRVYATWGTQADSLNGSNGQRFVLVCPSNGTLSSRVWGTDKYTNDSSICTAAVHAGLITTAAGGVITLEIRPGASSYQPSTRNGVASAGYGSWGSSFVFIR